MARRPRALTSRIGAPGAPIERGVAGPAVAPASGVFEGPTGSVLRATHEAILIVDAQQRIAALNPAAEQLLGCPAAEALGQSLARFVPAGSREAHADWVHAFASGLAASRAMAAGRRVELLRADGRTSSVEITLSRIEHSGADGAPAYCAALLHDVSSERALEQQVMQLERRMQIAFELSPIAIWICEHERIVNANRAAARLFGVPGIDSLLGRSLYELLHEDSHADLQHEVTRALAGAHEGAIVGGRLTRSDGRAREVEIALAAMPDHGSTTLQMVVNDVTERRREAADLEQSRRALRELSASVVEAREEERRRISRELHDELGQRLTALKIELANLAASTHTGVDDPRVVAMSATIDDTLASVRRIASDLRPLMLDDLGLIAAIEWQARDAARRMGIPVHTRLPLSEPVLDQRVAIALYRMVQEALTNVARHAQATEVNVELRVRGPDLLLAVSDDGIGLPAPGTQRAGSFGLMGMRERAHMLGGALETGSRPGGGTRLTVRLPAQPPAVDAVRG